MSSKASDIEADEMLAFCIFANFGYAKEGITHMVDWQENIETRRVWRIRLPAFKKYLGTCGLRTAVSSSQDLKKSLENLLELPPRPAYNINDEMKELSQCQSNQEKQKD